MKKLHIPEMELNHDTDFIQYITGTDIDKLEEESGAVLDIDAEESKTTLEMAEIVYDNITETSREHIATVVISLFADKSKQLIQQQRRQRVKEILLEEYDTEKIDSAKFDTILAKVIQEVYGKSPEEDN